MANLPTPILKLLRERHTQVAAWRLGVEAGVGGQPLTANPYGPLDVLASEWLSGHAEGTVTL